ncbi:MAG: metal-sensing transcriptional repressor [Actinomycetota bacterium]|jgi:DNA-binding FrmR family transcriptional regulator|nr:metal-sensing transcriptional repressor [Actinomycetota bacterium]
MQLDESTAAQVRARLRRVEGQLAGIVRMIDDGRDCEDVVTQLAAASRALSRAGVKIVASGMRQCFEAGADGAGDASRARRMEELFLSLA